MSFFDKVKNFFGVGDDDEEKKRKRDQQSKSSQSWSAPQRASTNSFNAPLSQSREQNLPSPGQINPLPVNGLNLELPGQTRTTPTGFPELLKKATPAIATDTTREPRKLDKVVNTVAGSTARVGVGIAQGAAGLYDLVTPGRGTNRFSDDLDREAKEIDAVSQREGYKPGYKVGNVIGEIGSYALPSVAATNLVKAVPKTASAVTKTVEKAADFVDGSNRLRKVVSSGMRRGLTPQDIAADAAITSKYAGENTSKGGDTSPTSLAADAALGVVGGTAAPLIGDAARGLRKAFTRSNAPDAGSDIPGVRSVNPNREADANAQQALKQEEQVANLNTARPVPSVPAKANLDIDSIPNADITPAYQRGFGTPEPTQSRDFVLRQKYGEMIRKRPDLAPQLRARLDELLKTPLPRQMEGAVISPRTPDVAPIPDTPAAEPIPTLVPVTTSADQVDMSVPEFSTPLTTPLTTPPAASPEPSIAQLSGQDTRPEAALQAAIEQAHNAGDNARVAQLIAQLPADMQPVMRSALGIDSPTVPVQAQPFAVATPADSAQAPAAPRLREAMKQQMGTADEVVAADAPNRDVLALDELNRRAEGIVAQADPDALIDMYNVPAAELETLIRTPQDYALGTAAMNRLHEMAKAGDTRANVAISNIYDAMGYGSSGSAQFLRATQQAFNSLPIPMKISKTIQRIEKLNAERFGADDPRASFDEGARATVMARFDELFTRDQAIREQMAAAQNTLDLVKQNPSAYTRDQIQTAGSAYKQAEEALGINNQRFAQVYDELTPGRDTADKIADWQRTAMLSAPTGRANDIIVTTGLNLPREAVNMGVEGLLGRAANTFRKVAGRSPGKYVQNGINASDLAKAVPTAVKKFRQELKGDNPVESIEAVVKQKRGAPDRTDLSGGKQGKLGRLVKASTNFATHLTEGIAKSEVTRRARQEGLQKGFKGGDLKNYVAASTWAPSPQLKEKGRIVHETLNNLNDNPITNTMRAIGQAAERNLGKPGKIIKNAVMPFPTWIGGNIWNAVTDRNVVASTLKWANAVRKGDSDAAIRNFSRSITGVAEAYAAGWILTQSGLLSETDANGDTYEGLYLHIGDRYIPVASLGNFAPNVILGYTTHKAFGDEEGNPVQNVGQYAMDLMGKSFSGLSVSTLTGGDNYLAKGAQQISDPKKRDQGASTLGAGAVGQFIPTALRDVNAVIDNETSLNPTREKSETKAIGEDGKTDWWKTTLNKLQDRVPVASQQLERKKDVAAPDLIDRTTRGNRDTPGGKQVRADEKAAEDRKADFEARGVPDPAVKGFEDAVQARFEDGEYDKAIEGLEARLADQESDKNISDKAKKETQDKIKLMEVHESGKFDPSVADIYRSTSLEEWRKLGDPDSDEYDADKYQKLWDYDTARANAGISKDDDDKGKNAYYAKESKAKKGGSSGSRGSAENRELARIRSNKVSGSPVLSKFSYGNLRPEKLQSSLVPKIAKLKANELVKKRTIKINKA